MQSNQKSPLDVGVNAATPALGATSAQALSTNAPPATPPAAPSAALSADLHHLFTEIVTPANLAFLKIMIMGAGAAAGKKAVELFVEQAKTWFSKKRSIKGFDVTPPPGMTIDSLKIEGEKVVIILKALGGTLAAAPAAAPTVSLEVPPVPLVAAACEVSILPTTVEKKKKDG